MSTEDFSVPDLSALSPEEKDRVVKEVVGLSSKHVLAIFYALGLKTHIETMIVNDATGDEFIFTFRKIIKDEL